MKKIPIFGIFREKSHSPRREYDDEAILRQTALNLAASEELEVRLFSPEEFLRARFNEIPLLIFFMCEEAPCLSRLRKLSYDTGCLLVNSVESVENTFRENMVAVLKEAPFFPKSRLFSTSSDSVPDDVTKCWLKRGDYHAISSDDVIFVRDKNELEAAMSGFSVRGIETVLVQKHVPGDIIKFYCVRDCRAGHTWWFKWFYHRDQDLKEYSFSETRLVENCLKTGDEMGLDIYGGDAIVRQDGRVFIIDVNAWPSFALFREEAAGAISQLVMARILEHAGAVSRPKINLQNILNLSA